MKRNISFSTDNQNIFKTYTASNGILRTELIAIAISEMNACMICTALTLAQEIEKTVSYKDTGLREIFELANSIKSCSES